MKGFFEWFKASTKIKRWMLLILIGIVLSCYGFSKILVADKLEFLDLLPIILLFVFGFIFVILGIIFIQKRTLELLIEANDTTTVKGKKASVNIKSLIFNKRVYEEGPKVVVIGGGTGLNTVIKGLKKYTNNITAIVTMSDYGADITQSRKELNLLPLNDIKESIISLSDKEELMKHLMNLKFQNERLRNLCFGDIYLLAMKELCGDISEGIKHSTEVLNIIGKVLPVTLDEITICAELNDGTTIEEKDKIPEIVTNRVEKINRIYISPSNCRPAPGVLEAIAEADAIVIGPGSLYTNVIPNLLVKNVAKAIKESKAIKVYVTNIMTEQGQTDNYSVSDHIQAIIDHVGKEVMDFCICDTGEVMPEYVRKYNKEGSDVVDQDISKATSKGVKIIQKNMSTIVNDKIRHNPDVIATSIIELICNDLKFKDKQGSTQYLLLNSVLKEEKKIEKKHNKMLKNHKNIVKKAERKVTTSNHKRTSKFSNKYKDRVKSIQTAEAQTAENRRIAEEIEKMQKSTRKKKEVKQEDLAKEIEKLTLSRENTQEKIKEKREKKANKQLNKNV